MGCLSRKTSLLNDQLASLALMSYPRQMTECPICASQKTQYFQKVAEYNFHKCDDCAFVFLDPMPTATVLESLYNNDGSITPEFYPKASSRFRRALSTAFRLYWYARGGNLLDVGCGGGFQVSAFRLFGINAHGLDISADSIAYASKNNKKNIFFCEEFDKFINRNKIYRFIYSSEVIEHVVDINEYMNFLNKCLVDRGYAYITTPDIGGRRVPENILEWDVFSPPRHVQFFCQENIVKLFERYGFTLVKRFSDHKAGLRILFRKN